MLKIRDFTFQEDWEGRRTCLMFFKADREESASWAVDIGFKPGDFEGNEISPSICINIRHNCNNRKFFGKLIKKISN